MSPNRPIIVTGLLTNFQDVNPLLALATPIHNLHECALFLPLLDEQPDHHEGPPSFKPRLAESWGFSEDRLTLTFHLRSDVLWSDGEPVTAEDVRWTWRAQIHPAVGWNGADSKRHIRDVEVIDPTTVRFHFTQRSLTQLVDATQSVILPRHLWSQLPFDQWRDNSEWFFQHLVTSGPYKLESRNDRGFVLTANDRYYEPGLPKSKRIEFRLQGPRETDLQQLRTGEIDLVTWAMPDEIAAFAEVPEVEAGGSSRGGVIGLVWNLGNPLFSSTAVRRALAMAINRQGIVREVYGDHARPSESLFPSCDWPHNQDLEPLPYDPDRAQELLKEEGWSENADGVLNKDRRTFEFEILTPAGNDLRHAIVARVIEDLRRVGINARLNVGESDARLRREISHEFEAATEAFAIGTNMDLCFLLHSRGPYNLGSYANPEVDRRLEAIRGQDNQREAKLLYDQLQVLLRDEQPWTCLYETGHRLLTSLRGVGSKPLSVYSNIQHWEVRS